MGQFVFYGGLNPGSQIITATGAGSFTVPAYTSKLRVRGWGAGGGGAGSTNNASAGIGGSAGGPTTFSGLTAGGGGSPPNTPSTAVGVGGTASGGDINTSGENGVLGDFQGTQIGRGGAAANTAQGGGARALVPQTNARKFGTNGNSYGGGGSGATGLTGGGLYFTMTGGGGGAFVEKVYNVGDLNAGSSISYSVGAGGAGGNSDQDGGNGANGALVIEWDYE